MKSCFQTTVTWKSWKHSKPESSPYIQPMSWMSSKINENRLRLVLSWSLFVLSRIKKETVNLDEFSRK